MLSGKGYLALLPVRLGQALLVAPVTIVCLRLVAPRLCQALYRLGWSANPGVPTK